MPIHSPPIFHSKICSINDSCYYGLLEVVVIGSDVPAALNTTEKRGVGTETEVVLEAMLDIIEKSACETGIVVAETEGVLDFEMSVVDVTLLLETDVVPAVSVLLPSDVVAFVAFLELAGVSDTGEVVEVVSDAAELVDLDVSGADVVLAFAGVLAVKLGVVEALLETTEVVSVKVRAVEVVSELAGALALDVDVADWFTDFVIPLDPDVEETDVIVDVSGGFETDAPLVDLALAFVCVLVEGNVLTFEVLTIGSLLVEVDVRLPLVLETSGALVVVLSEGFEVLEMCDFMLVIAEEAEIWAEAEVDESVPIISNVDNLKQDISPKAS